MFLKRVRKIVSVVAVLVLTAVIGYACIFNTFTLTRIVLPLLSSFSGVEMKAAYLDYAPFTGRAAGKDIRIGSEKYPLKGHDDLLQETDLMPDGYLERFAYEGINYDILSMQSLFVTDIVQLHSDRLVAHFHADFLRRHIPELQPDLPFLRIGDGSTSASSEAPPK